MPKKGAKKTKKVTAKKTLKAVALSPEEFFAQLRKEFAQTKKKEKLLGQLKKLQSRIAKRISDDEWFGTGKPSKSMRAAQKAFREFVFMRDANESSEAIKEKYGKWRAAKEKLKRYYRGDWREVMRRFAEQAGMPETGSFSIQSFLTS